jgi:hypothetical protein
MNRGRAVSYPGWRNTLMAHWLPEGSIPTALPRARRVSQDPLCRSGAFRKSFVQIRGLPQILRADQGLKKAFSEVLGPLSARETFGCPHICTRDYPDDTDDPLSARRIHPDSTSESQTGQPGSFAQIRGLPQILRADQGLKKAFSEVLGPLSARETFGCPHICTRDCSGGSDDPLSARRIQSDDAGAPSLCPTGRIGPPAARVNKQGPARRSGTGPCCWCWWYCVTGGISPAGRPRGQQRHQFRPSALPARPAALRNRRSAGTAPGRPRCCGPPACRQC